MLMELPKTPIVDIQTITPNSSTTGSPRFYALFDTDNFIVAPTPSSSFAVELHYYYRTGMIMRDKQ